MTSSDQKLGAFRAGAVRSAGVNIFRIVIGFDTLLGGGVIRANSWYAILHGDTVRTRIGAKVCIERTVLLHDDNDVFDLVTQESGLT